jgi:hypothetical protein
MNRATTPVIQSRTTAKRAALGGPIQPVFDRVALNEFLSVQQLKVYRSPPTRHLESINAAFEYPYNHN